MVITIRSAMRRSGFLREGGGQKPRVFQEAKPTFGLGLPFVSVEHCLGGELVLVQCVRGEDETALLVDKRPAVRAPRRQGSCDMVDALVGLCSRAWAPPLPIAWRGADGTLMEKRGLQGVYKRTRACWRTVENLGLLYPICVAYVECILERTIRTRADMKAAKGRRVKFGRKPKRMALQNPHDRQLLDRGQTVQDVAALLNVHRTTLYRALAAHQSRSLCPVWESMGAATRLLQDSLGHQTIQHTVRYIASHTV